MAYTQSPIRPCSEHGDKGYTESGIGNRMRGPQKNRAAGSQEDGESGNIRPIHFKLTKPLLCLTFGLLLTEIRAIWNREDGVLTLSLGRMGG